MLTAASIARLRDDFLVAGYTLDEVSERLGPQGMAALGRNSTFAGLDALGDDRDRQATLLRLWVLQATVPIAEAEVAVDCQALLEHGLLRVGPDGVTANVEIKPYGAEDFTGWICSDLTPMDGDAAQPRPDFVLGASPASTTLAQLVSRRPVDTALDLGTGCGIQSLHLARHAREVVATDLNPRALAMARLTLGLNEERADLLLGSLYEPVVDRRFNLIVTNPPYVMSPPDGARLVYREGAMPSDDLVRRVVVEGAQHLAGGGLLQVLGNWAIIRGEPWPERLHAWIAKTGCDALVLQREDLDPYEYIEVWLADAGLVGSPAHRPAYRRWKDYFDGLGVTGVGMGWIFLANHGRESPEVRIEDWPHAVHQPVARAVEAFFDAIPATRLTDAALLASAWRVHPAVVQETLGRPGAADPQHIVLRQRFGFGRAVEADTALAATVGACDGELPLGVLVEAVAGLLEVDATGLAEELVPRVRSLVAEGFLQSS